MHVDRLNEYQQASRRTWSLIKTDHAIVYPTLGLVNEAGEVAGKVKKSSATGLVSSVTPTATRSSTSSVMCCGIWRRFAPSSTSPSKMSPAPTSPSSMTASIVAPSVATAITAKQFFHVLSGQLMANQRKCWHDNAVVI